MGVVNEQYEQDMLETPTSLGSRMAGDDIQDRLRSKLIAKRELEGQELPEDLFAKKPKYSMTDEEQKRSEERRRRNKEAAEKSRKKKKEEFEKLQQENDQLNQDKCELAAMISKLNRDVDALTGENVKLKLKMEQLCRFIANRAKDFGLDKHMEKQQHQQTVITDHDSSHPILRRDRDPTLPRVALKQRRVSEEHLARRSPVSSAGSPRLLQDSHMLMGVTTTKQLQTPWLVEQSATIKPEEAQPHDDQEVVIVDTEEEQQMVVGEHILYLPKDTVLIVQDGSSKQVTAVEAGVDAGDEESENGEEDGGGETTAQAEAVSNSEGNSNVHESEPASSDASETESTSATAEVSSAPTTQETVVSTTTTATTNAAGNGHVSREALLTFVEALIKAGVKFDTSTLPSLLNKPSDTKLNETRGKTEDDHNYLPATPPRSPQKANSNILLAH